jgi:hypothetical protein
MSVSTPSIPHRRHVMTRHNVSHNFGASCEGCTDTRTQQNGRAFIRMNQPWMTLLATSSDYFIASNVGWAKCTALKSLNKEMLSTFYLTLSIKSEAAPRALPRSLSLFPTCMLMGLIESHWSLYFPICSTSGHHRPQSPACGYCTTLSPLPPVNESIRA